MAMVAAILGLDTAAGAYLARLLGARGYAVRGSGGAALLERLGIAGDVTRAEDAAVAAIGADEVYDLRGDAVATRALLTSGVRRLFVAVDPADADAIARLAAARDAGCFVAIGRVFAHESRFGPGTSPVARIVAALAAGETPDAADLASSTDCGWTAEYVDPMWRLLQRPLPEDLAIATGRLLTGAECARVAAAWFKRPAPAAVTAVEGVTGDVAAAKAALGWSAVTWGDDLVEVLCEGAASA